MHSQNLEKTPSPLLGRGNGFCGSSNQEGNKLAFGGELAKFQKRYSSKRSISSAFNSRLNEAEIFIPIYSGLRSTGKNNRGADSCQIGFPFPNLQRNITINADANEAWS
jgi:hypothetical protein